MKIAVVDDSRTMRMIVVRTLRQAGFGGHEVVEADDGARGARTRARPTNPTSSCPTGTCPG